MSDSACAQRTEGPRPAQPIKQACQPASSSAIASSTSASGTAGCKFGLKVLIKAAPEAALACAFVYPTKRTAAVALSPTCLSALTILLLELSTVPCHCSRRNKVALLPLSGAPRPVGSYCGGGDAPACTSPSPEWSKELRFWCSDFHVSSHSLAPSFSSITPFPITSHHTFYIYLYSRQSPSQWPHQISASIRTGSGETGYGPLTG